MHAQESSTERDVHVPALRRHGAAPRGSTGQPLHDHSAAAGPCEGEGAEGQTGGTRGRGVGGHGHSGKDSQARSGAYTCALLRSASQGEATWRLTPPVSFLSMRSGPLPHNCIHTVHPSPHTSSPRLHPHSSPHSLSPHLCLTPPSSLFSLHPTLCPPSAV